MTRMAAIVMASLSLLLPACDDSKPKPAADSTADRSSPDRSTPDRSAGDRSAQDQALADAPPYACPAAIPSGTCSQATYPHTCWYGTDARWFCRTSALCATGGTWQVQPPLAECQSPPPAGCPPSASSPYPDCAVDAGVKPVCVYSDRYCRCGFTGGPQPGWTCTVIPTGCPALPPDEGDPCSTSASCLYYPCSKSAACESGTWHWHSLEC
jgi:hypothetical protein